MANVMTNAQIQAELGRLDQLRDVLVAQISSITPAEQIKALADAQPHVKPKTVEAAALLQSGYHITVEEARKIIKERDANPVTWPLEEYRKAQAMLEAYNATPVVISTRDGWHRTRGV